MKLNRILLAGAVGAAVWFIWTRATKAASKETPPPEAQPPSTYRVVIRVKDGIPEGLKLYLFKGDFHLGFNWLNPPMDKLVTVLSLTPENREFVVFLEPSMYTAVFRVGTLPGPEGGSISWFAVPRDVYNGVVTLTSGWTSK